MPNCFDYFYKLIGIKDKKKAILNLELIDKLIIDKRKSENDLELVLSLEDWDNKVVYK